eukprot:scaffold8723_cov116-Isochrysis_galbana.AAC.6
MSSAPRPRARAEGAKPAAGGDGPITGLGSRVKWDATYVGLGARYALTPATTPERKQRSCAPEVVRIGLAAGCGYLCAVVDVAGVVNKQNWRAVSFKIYIYTIYRRPHYTYTRSPTPAPCGSMSCMVGPSWPHIACMCLQDSSRPRKGCGKAPAPAQWSTSLGTRGVGSFSRPLVPSLPRRHVLGKCACFCAEGIGSSSPSRQGRGIIVWGRKQQRTTCKAMMTDPPTDDTEAREQDAPDPTDAKHRAHHVPHLRCRQHPLLNSKDDILPTNWAPLPPPACPS